MSEIVAGARVVVAHNGYPRWGTVTVPGVADNTPVEVVFERDHHVTLVKRDLVYATGPTPFPDDGIADYYWRKRAEVHAEYLAHQAKDPATRGPFRPFTLID